jgi:hypothetical protein
MSTKFSTILILVVLLLGCVTQKKSPHSSKEESLFRFIGEVIIPNDLRVDSTLVGGISGIDFDGKQTYYLICDDAVRYNAIRYYTATLDYNNSRFEKVTINKATILTQENGVSFPSIEKSDSIYVDPEAVRLLPDGKSILWSSEGHRNRKIAEPLIYKHNLNGGFKSKIFPNSYYGFKKEGVGARHNAVFEGLTLVPNSDLAWVSLESALLQDGAAANDIDAGAPVRFFQINYETGETVKEIAYQIEKVFAPLSENTFGINGIVEILWYGTDELLVLERGYVVGKGNKIRLFLASIKNSSDILGLESIAKSTIQIANKMLILDFDSLPISKVDNIEGMTWGKTLENGNPTLIFVSDNNFSDEQVSQFIVLELNKSLIDRTKPF